MFDYTDDFLYFVFKILMFRRAIENKWQAFFIMVEQVAL